MPTINVKPRPSRRAAAGIPPFAERVRYPRLPEAPRLPAADVARLFVGVTEVAGVPVVMRLDLPPITPAPPAVVVRPPAPPVGLACPVCRCDFGSPAGLARHVARTHPLTRELAELVRKLTKTCPADLRAARAY